MYRLEEFHARRELNKSQGWPGNLLVAIAAAYLFVRMIAPWIVDMIGRWWPW